MKGTITKAGVPYPYKLTALDYTSLKQEVTVERGRYSKEVTVHIGKVMSPLSVGDPYRFTIKHITQRFTDRLAAIGITVELGGNYPWIYLDKVNDVPVEGVFQARHGFTAFFMQQGDDCRFSDRRVVFNKIREMLNEGMSYE
tara:strand:+ start:876 stop:1301 length:426 start_codon:yes stop_codon:yes gene_type:complete